VIKVGTIEDAAKLANTLANDNWDTYKADYGDVTKPTFNLVEDDAAAGTRFRGNRDEVLFFLISGTPRAGNDGYRDIFHDYKGRSHRVQVDIRSYTSRANLLNMLNILNKIFEIKRMSPGTGYDKIAYPYGDGIDFSSEKNKRWRWVLDIAFIKEYDLVHS